MNRIRPFLVVIHRYAGLSMAVFLVIAGLTGSVLAFYHELDAALNPRLYQLSPSEIKGQALDPLVLRDIVSARYPNIQITWVPLATEMDTAINFRVRSKIDPQTGLPYALDYDELFVNPYTGEVQGKRLWGDISQGVKNLIPFIYKLHYQLALGNVGSVLMGIIALVWTIDCFVGAYLTFPRKASNLHPRKTMFTSLLAWLKRWRPAWKVRMKDTSRFRLNYDLHSAGALWTWMMLFILAWSSVGFNLNKEVYHPVMALFFDMQDTRTTLPVLSTPNLAPQLSYAEARAIALNYLSSPNPHHLKQIQPFGMSYLEQSGLYHYRFVSNQDIQSSRGNTRMYIDGNTGKIIDIYIPTGKANGDTLTAWIRTLHMADLWGMPFKVFVSVMGVIVLALSVTGVYIWWKKHKARLVKKTLFQPKAR